MQKRPTLRECQASLDLDLQTLADQRSLWVRTSVDERIAILHDIKDETYAQAQAWADTASRKKGIPAGSQLEGEEWLSGPHAILGYCNQMMATLSKVKGKHHLDGIPLRELPNGQVAARVMPNSLWDHLLFNGVTLDVWMQPGITRANLKEHTASIYDPESQQGIAGKVSLVLGAGNIAAIAPLDVFHKLFAENQVVILKLNPVNDYLEDFFIPIFKPLIDRGFVRIVRGDTDVGQYLCNHPLVETIHITGAGASHDTIVWGPGEQGRANKAANTPINHRHITSELGAVCPTIVVPGPWSAADIRFQAEQVATQKLHNSGFNCVACQVLILPKEWEHQNTLMEALERVIRHAPPRALYYPGAKDRLAEFCAHNPGFKTVSGQDSQSLVISKLDIHHIEACSTEVFAPALNVMEIGGLNAEEYLVAAIEFANSKLYGTLGANIVIHPDTIQQIGRHRFEQILAELRYGTIAINAWTGLNFLSAQSPWGAFPGHTLTDVQSGIGVVHNTLLFEKTQRAVVEAPFRPFPRNLLSLSFTLLPRPPWFITHRRAAILGKLLVAFQHRPSLLKMPRIFWNALQG